MTLTPEMIADGWLPWGGGDCPVPGDSKVSVMCRDGLILHDDLPNDRADEWFWSHAGHSSDIITYRSAK